jgi:hypothetical protein
MITFNYDLVVETVAEAIKSQVRYTIGSRPGSGVTLLKLHGSVNWILQADPNDSSRKKVKTEHLNRRLALDCADDELAIAGPGPSKQSLSSGAFQPYWEQALDALRNASAIVFVGYRFPPTDAEAREKLLGAIRENKQEYVAIHTVLGPNTSSDDSRRLSGLVEHAVAGKRRMVPEELTADNVFPNRCYNIRQQPLWAEDFFSVVDRGRILRPDRLT